MMKLSNVAVSGRQVLRAAASLAGVVMILGVASNAQANCAEFAGRALRRAPIRFTPESGRAGSGAQAYTISNVSFDENEAITGLWHLEFVAGGVVVDSAFETFMEDGNELMVDTTAPSLGNVCNGVWVRSGPRAYKLKHPSFLFNTDGSVAGTAVFRTELKLPKKGNNTFTGQTVIEFYDTTGHLLDRLAADVRATRITVD